MEQRRVKRLRSVLAADTAAGQHHPLIAHSPDDKKKATPQRRFFFTYKHQAYWVRLSNSINA